MRIAFAVAALLLFRAGPAGADLYRWIDPETGSVKFSSYPPPWFGDAAAPRNAPKVEVIPSRVDTAAKPETPGKRVEGSVPLKGAQSSPANPAKTDNTEPR